MIKTYLIKCHLKKIILLLLLGFAVVTGYAQQRPVRRTAATSSDTTINPFNISGLKKIYQTREAIASPELKRRLAQQRTVIARNGFKYQVANTGVSEYKLKDITGFTTTTRTEILRIRDIQKNKPYNSEIAERLKNYKPPADASLQEFDARNYIKIPAIRQQKCGSCWVYGAISLLEISYMAQLGYSTNTTIDLSEKQVLGCSTAGSCDGGWHFKVYEWMKNTNQKLLSEQNLKDDDFYPKKSSSPDAGFVDLNCNVASVKSGFIQLLDWGIVQKDKDLDKIADEYDIKEAIIKYGAVATSLYASPAFQIYASSEPFEENESAYKDSAINHVVTIIGWDNKKQAWLIRNSWGTAWGDDGYGWIKFTTNHIGKHAIWAVAKPVINRLNLPNSDKETAVTLTGELLSGIIFPEGSKLNSPNGKFELSVSNNMIWLKENHDGGGYKSSAINPFNDYNIISKLYSYKPLSGSNGKSIFYVEDKSGNIFTPFGDNPFSKLVLTDYGNLIAYGPDEKILWSLNPVPPKIRRR